MPCGFPRGVLLGGVKVGYSPELNPQEHIWDELREKYFHNQAFDSMDALEEQLLAGLRYLEQSPAIVKSIAGWDWILNSVSNAN